MAASERIPVLATAAEKGRIAKMPKAAGLSMGEFLRRAAASFRPSEDDKVLEFRLGDFPGHFVRDLPGMIQNGAFVQGQEAVEFCVLVAHVHGDAAHGRRPEALSQRLVGGVFFGGCDPAQTSPCRSVLRFYIVPDPTRARISVLGLMWI